LHAHVFDPGVFVHVAFTLHPPLFVWHSSTSVHAEKPSPVYPVLQTHVLFVHEAFATHSALVLHVPAVHTPAPLQTLEPAHSLSGSMLLLMYEHTPLTPWPFFAAEHA